MHDGEPVASTMVMSITNVNDHSAALWRETWISVYGVPLIAWNYNNFLNIGSVMGRVISVNYKNYDCANILIFTDCLFDINCKLSLEIADVSYPVFVTEKKQMWCQMSSSAQGPSNKPDKSPNTSPAKSDSGTPSGHEKTSPEQVKSKSHSYNDETPAGEDTGFENNNHKVQEQPSQNILSTPPFETRDQIPSNPQKTKGTQNITHNSQTRQINSPPPVQLPGPPQTTSQSKNQKNPLQTKPPIIPSPTKPNSSLNQTWSPTKIHKSSPILIHNKYEPLQRQLKPKSSSSTLGSSSCSGPLFPPGFEDCIPNHTKEVEQEKRWKKMGKKKKIETVILIHPANHYINSLSPNNQLHPSQ